MITRTFVGKDYTFEGERVTVVERLPAKFSRPDLVRIKYHSSNTTKLVVRSRFAEAATE